MIVLKVLKIIGSIILIISAVFYFIHIRNYYKKNQDEQEVPLMTMDGYGICFMLLGFAAALLATL